MSVLTATDFSEPSKRALRIAGREARLRGVPLTVVHSVELAREQSAWWNIFESDRISPEQLHENARRRLETFVREQLPARYRPHQTYYQTDIDSPAETIRQFVERLEPSLVTIGATGRGKLASVVVGSTAEEVVRSVPAPVLTAPGDADAGPFETVLVPVDFSKSASAGLREAIPLVRRNGGRLIVMHEAHMHSTGFGRPPVGPANGVNRSHRLEFQARLSEYLSEFDLAGVDYETAVQVLDFETHTPADAIIDRAEKEEADLIVMGTHGRRGVRRFLLGSTTVKVLHRIPCPLLTVCPSQFPTGNP